MVRLWAALMNVGPPPASASTRTHIGYLANFAYVFLRAVTNLRIFFSVKNICANKSVEKQIFCVACHEEKWGSDC